MNDTNEELMKLFAGQSNYSQPTTPIIIRNIPSISIVERKLLFTNLPDQLDAELEALVDKASMEVFGVTKQQTMFLYPDDFEDLSEISERRGQIDDNFDQHEADYLTSAYGDEDTAKMLLYIFGLDFRDENGNPLRCVRYFKRQAEIAARGKMGKLPDMAAINDSNNEERMFAKAQREADVFRKKK